jgi:predicted cupin superfamily sugar epimerase
MIDPSPLRRVRRDAGNPSNWHRSRGDETWMTLAGMYGAVHSWHDPTTKTWIAWIRSGEHTYPTSRPKITRTEAAICAAQIALAHGFQG